MSSAATFIAAVEALNGAPGDSQRQADSWLSEFKYSADAWPTILHLLQQDISHDVLFHVTSIALSKAKNDWKKLSLDERRQVTQVVRFVSFPPVSAMESMHSTVIRPKQEAPIAQKNNPYWRF